MLSKEAEDLLVDMAESGFEECEAAIFSGAPAHVRQELIRGRLVFQIGAKMLTFKGLELGNELAEGRER